MSLLGLSNLSQSYQGQAVNPVSPVRQVPDRNIQTESPQEAVKSPKFDTYAPSQEGLDYVQNMSADVATADSGVADMEEVDNMDGTYGSPTVMPEIDQELGAAIPDDLIDPTDPSNLETYDPEAWLAAYRDEKANPNTTEIGPSSGLDAGGSATEETVFDPSDASNLETYDPSAWLANYRGEAVPEKAPTEESTDTTVDVEESVEEEETDSNSFDLQAFLSEADSIAKDVVSQLSNTVSSYSNTDNWLDLLESTKLFG